MTNTLKAFEPPLAVLEKLLRIKLVSPGVEIMFPFCSAVCALACKQGKELGFRGDDSLDFFGVDQIVIHCINHPLGGSSASLELSSYAGLPGRERRGNKIKYLTPLLVLRLLGFSFR